MCLTWGNIMSPVIHPDTAYDYMLWIKSSCYILSVIRNVTFHKLFLVSASIGALNFDDPSHKQKVEEIIHPVPTPNLEALVCSNQYLSSLTGQR